MKRSGRALLKQSVGSVVRSIPASGRALTFLLRAGFPDRMLIPQSGYPIDSRPRYGNGRPSHALLTDLLDRSRDAYRQRLAGFLQLRDQLAAIPTTASPSSPLEPAWMDGYIPGLDLVALYCFLSTGDPERYVEVGSGKSTKIARRAIRDQGLRTRITSIDPHPRTGIDSICDEVVRLPLEQVDVESFDSLRAGDILFVDGSHRVLMNSDVTVAILEILPKLRPGVIAHFHDIFLPYDYPLEWRDRYYSEQYLLAAYLLGGAGVEVLLPNLYVHRDEELNRVLDPLWEDSRLAGVVREDVQFLDWRRGGSSFWLRA